MLEYIKQHPMEIINLSAIFWGPILAVLAARYLEVQSQIDQRKSDVFKTLMRTRRSVLSSDHVGALNLVELEYADNAQVISLWKNLFTHFGTEHNRRADEKLKDEDSKGVVEDKNVKFFSRLNQERQALLAKLLHAMAKDRKFKAEQLDIFEGGYVPQGWVDIENEQSVARRYLLDLSRGVTAVPVLVFYPETQGDEK